MQNYLSNAFLAAAIAIVVSIIMGPIMIPFLKRLKVGQSIREEGPKGHYAKQAPPPWGIIIITAVMLASFIMAGTSTEALAGCC